MEAKKQKRAQTSIITMVILIIIGIAGVAVLSAFVFPMIKQSLEARDINPEISIVEDGTFYNNQAGLAANSGCSSGCLDKLKVYVKLKRGSSSDILNSLRFIFLSDGETTTYYSYKIPEMLEERTYYFELTNVKALDEVRLAPVVLIKGSQKGLDVISDVVLKLDNNKKLPTNVESCSRLLQVSNSLPLPPAEDCMG